MDEQQKHYLDVLERNGGIEGKTLLDVGSYRGEFVSNALDHGVKESWGVDHNKDCYEVAMNAQGIGEHYLHMSFGEIPARHPELKHKFDIIKITAVTPYASAEEFRRMGQAAHFLLKPGGKIMLEMPWMNKMGKAFGPNQTLEETQEYLMSEMQETMQLSRMPNSNEARTAALKELNESKKMQKAYRQLFNLYFNEFSTVEPFKTDLGHHVPLLMIGGSKDKIPKLEDIRFDSRTLELAPIRDASRKPPTADAMKAYRKRQDEERKKGRH